MTSNQAEYVCRTEGTMDNTILLLRHGETSLNRSGALRGHIDVPLSDVGRREASQLAARVAAEYTLAAIYSSPLRRARMTAAEIANATGLDVAIDERFTDIDYGPWAGRLWESFSADEQQEFRRWQRSPERPLRGVESPVAAQHQALAGLEDLAVAGRGCIAIVTHDAIMQLILCHVLGVDLRSYRGIVQHTATLNEVQRSASGWKVHLLNSTWHLGEPGA
jgi:broad specificity phosphatase PhoE